MSGLDRMFAKVVLASRPTNGALPLITMHLHYPDIIHGEVLTHRKFSRNARSMRAVPVKTMAQEVIDDPFMPWHWGKNQRGMQASEECNELIALPGSPIAGGPLVTREAAWLLEAKHAAEKALAFDAAGYHKQVANRILAPYTWKHTLITSTSWANFLHLRDHEDAEPHFHDLAGMVREALAGAEYQTLNPGEWHLPYFRGAEDHQEAVDYLRNRQQIMPTDERLLAIYQKLSVARSARISYAPFDGDASIERELERYDLLVGSEPLHASPTEHQATPDEVENETADGLEFFNEKLSGNFAPGWIQYRKTLAGEYMEDPA